jgi:hypothetical protein
VRSSAGCTTNTSESEFSVHTTNTSESEFSAHTAVEAYLARGRTPAPAGPFRIAPVARTGEPLGVLAQHLLQRSNAGGQAKAFERDVHIFPRRLQAWRRRNR